MRCMLADNKSQLVNAVQPVLIALINSVIQVSVTVFEYSKYTSENPEKDTQQCTLNEEEV